MKKTIQDWLKEADKALYQAWRQSFVNGNTMREIDAAQEKIQALIRAKVDG